MSWTLENMADEIIALLPTLKKAIRISEFESWIAPFSGAKPEFTRLPFDHPGFVLFSSGTTGKPKCITHSGAGVMLKAGAEQLYQFDMKAGERVFFFTTCGWMMWNLRTSISMDGFETLVIDIMVSALDSSKN